MSSLMPCVRHTNTWNTAIIPQILKALLSIFVIFSVVACVPSPGNASPTAVKVTQVQPTPDPASTPTDTPTATPLPETATGTALGGGPLRFIAEADAFVRESDPDTNYGSDLSLRVDGGSQPDEGFLRFAVTGLTDPVQEARLRLYATDNGSSNGPAVFVTGGTWAENEITWNRRPLPEGSPLDNKDLIDTESWVEYDVTAAITGDGSYNFVLMPDSTNAVTFSSREGSRPPELVISFGGETATVPAPATLEAGAQVLVGAGDISRCGNDNDELTAQLLDGIPGIVFTTGDNVYNDGTYEQFIDCYDPTWGRHKDRTRPVPGNHDYRTPDGAGYSRYFDNIPSYYAYDLGNWRIYALNSEIDVSADSPQVTWLQDDLAANPRQCVLAYWHQPRWSSGSTHGNDRSYRTFWKILYEAGAELVLNGHEHSYERFSPMNLEGEPDPLGLREIVVGTGGASLYPFAPPLPGTEVRNNTTYGVLKITLHSDRYDWEFIPVRGSTFTDSGSTACH